MIKNSGIALKLAVLILTSTTLIFSSAFAYNYWVSRKILVEKIQENARNLADSTVNQLDTVLRAVQEIPESLAYTLEAEALDQPDLIRLLRSTVSHNPEIFGSAVAYEPYAYIPEKREFSPYCYRLDGELKVTFLGGEEYAYHRMDWYQIPREVERPIWSEPYYDEGGGDALMSTYSVPFYETSPHGRRILGIVTVDLSLDWLQEIVSSIQIEQSGFAFIISKNGTFITYPESGFVMNETIFSIAEAEENPRLRRIGRKMIQGGSGYVQVKSLTRGKECWMAYAPLSSNGWSLGVLFPQQELMAPLVRLNRAVVFLGLGGLIVLCAVIVGIARSITRPLHRLAYATRNIAEGNLDIDLPRIQTHDEVGRLSQAFEHMRTSLKQYIRDLTETTAAKERIESELKIAHDIQMGILPKTYPPYPHIPEIDLYATLVPAREVGGDLYDFYFIDETRLCFMVGDVSGKGVPAALFMAVTKTLLKTKASQGLSPTQIVTSVNEDLSLDNPSMMFVTLFLGVLDVSTGRMTYCNGGHNPPYLLQKGGQLSPLESTQGMALGVMEDFAYTSRTIDMEPGDGIFLYTDGVTEAVNTQLELFSEARMEHSLLAVRQRGAKELILEMLGNVETYAQGTEQADDITMLFIRLEGLKTPESPGDPAQVQYP